MVCTSTGINIKVTAPSVEKNSSYLTMVLKITLVDNREWKIVFNGSECTACRNCCGRVSGLWHLSSQAQLQHSPT